MIQSRPWAEVNFRVSSRMQNEVWNFVRDRLTEVVRGEVYWQNLNHRRELVIEAALG